MRIISDFRDFYDISLSQGFDESLVFLRKTEIMNVSSNEEKKLPPLRLGFYSFGNQISVSAAYLGFCGKIYPILVQSKLGPNYQVVEKNYAFGTEDFLNYLTRFTDISKLPQRQKDYFKSSLLKINSIESINQFFLNENKEFLPLFHQQQTPIFLYIEEMESIGSKKKPVIIKNPNLKELSFHKIKDAFQTFQEISMFLGGVLKGTENEMVKISDNDKIHKHGFDKWSFRKKGKNSK